MKTIHPLEESESIVAVIQDHWVVMIMPFLLYLVGWLLAVTLFFLGDILALEIAFLDPIFKLLALLTVLAIHHWLFIYFFWWEMSSWIITTHRLIGFRFLPYVRHDTSFVMIQEINEIDKRKHGLIQNVFNYGTIQINLLAGHEMVLIEHVPNPSRMVNLVSALEEARQNGTSIDVEELRQRFSL